MLQSDREYVLPSVSHNTMFYHKQKLYTQLKEPSSLIYKLKDNAINLFVLKDESNPFFQSVMKAVSVTSAPAQTRCKH